MLDLIRKAIGSRREEAAAAESGEDAELKIRVAACVILLEAAHADFDIKEEEFNHVLETIKERFAIPHDYAEELVEMARMEKEQALDLWQFTNRMNQTFSHEEKAEVMEAVWRIIYADGRLDKHEDHFARKLAYLLRLTHRDMIDAKLRAKERMG